MAETIILNNRYRLEERQGSGGMAMVYRATDLMLERPVAIKVLRRDFSSDPEFRERFRQEAKAAANLSHPNIVTVHDFGLDADRLFIVMEFVAGVDLKTILQRRGRLGLTDTLSLMVQAGAGLGYAHRAGLVHCDIKPQNMLVNDEKRLKVVDFGIARALASIQPDERAEVVWGSPQYFSPEQAAGSAPSPASDVYSLGVVMFELLTGQLPFTADSPEDLAQMHRSAPPPLPRSLNPAIPPAIEQIILKTLAKEPSSRYRTADQLGRVLATFIQQSHTANVAVPAFPEAQEIEELRHAVHETRPMPSPVNPAVEYPLYTQDGEGYSGPAPATLPGPAYIPNAIPQVPRAAPLSRPARFDSDFDWITWLLGLLALIAAGGLIPFLMWLYYLLYPPL